MPELQVPADWYDMSMVSNRLRQTYVNGFLDVSNIFTARRDANIVGTIRQSEEGMYDAPSYVGTNVDNLSVNESFTLDTDCVVTFKGNDINNTGVFNNDGSFNNTGNLSNVGVFNNDGSVNNAGDISNVGVFNNDGSFNNTGTFTNNGNMVVTQGTLYSDITFIGNSDISNVGNFYNAGDLSNVGVFNNDGSFNNTGDIINNGRIINNGTLEITDNVLYTDVSFAGISDLSLNGFINLNGNMTIKGSEGYKWNTYGQVLSGPYESNSSAQFGVSTDIDASGTTIVVGANTVSTGAYADNGAVYVYRYDAIAEMWYQLGNTIDSPTTTANTGRFGRLVQISANGNRIAVLNYLQHDLYFYDYNSGTNTWVSAGSILDGEHGLSDVRNDQAIHLSGDGNTIIFGDLAADTNFANSGTTLVYRNSSGTTWTKIGELHGSAVDVYSQGGAISYNGNRIYFGEKAYNYDSTGAALADTGRVAIYDYSGSGTTWTQVGDWIYQDRASGVFGFTGSMSNDGSIVAIHGHPAGGEGNISVYQYDATIDGSWNQLGSTIVGVTNQRDWGYGVKISNDGTTLVAGHVWYDGTKIDQGALYVYKYINGDWEQQGDIIIATYTNITFDDRLGFTHSYAINGDGTKIVGGVLSANLNSADSGAVQAWQWSKKAPYTNPALNVSGGTTTMWGGAEENPNNWEVTQVGSTLSGNTNSDFGDDVKLNANGSVMVIGAPGENGMYVYKYRNDPWSQSGSKITHSSYSGQGERVVINDDGTIVSTGTNSNAMNVWEFTNGDWSLKGTTITNGSGTIYFGNRGNAMNGAGNRVAGKSTSFIAAYEYDTSTSDWVQMGSNITSYDSWNSGYTNELAMNKAGDILAIGMPGYDQPRSDTGRVAIYKFTGDISDGSWNRMGNYITPPHSGFLNDGIGLSVSLSDDGYTVAFSSPLFGDNDDLGRGYVYKYSGIGNRWDPYGPEIKQADVFRETSFTTTRFASGIRISGDGKMLAISDHNGSPTSTTTNVVGFLHVMKYIDGHWTWIGRLDGTDHGDYWAAKCSISRDGTHIAGSATLINSSNIGEVKVGKITNNPYFNIDDDGNITMNGKVDNIRIGEPMRYDGGTNSIGKLTVAGPLSSGVSNDFSNSVAIFRVVSSNSSNNMQMGVGGESYNNEPWIQASYDNSSTTNNSDHGVKKLRLNPLGGNIVRHGESSYSDDRVKINETYISNATETLNKLKPQTYTRYAVMDPSGNIDYNSWSKFEAGLIAQEIYYDAPELRHIVYVPHDADVSGNDISTSDDPKVDPDYSNWGTDTAAVEYTQLIPYLIKSNQEQQEEINTLKTENATLNTQMTDVLARLSSLESAQTT